jgi:predicted dehydrogenase
LAQKLKAGVIACGSIAQAMHLPGYANCPGVELVAACDPVRKRLTEAKKIKGDLRTYSDHRKMLQEEALDIVSVCSPNKFHSTHAIAALNHGASVLLEKPAALSMKEIVQMKAAEKKSDGMLIVGFSHRFMRGNKKINKMVKDGVIGAPYMIRFRLAHTGPYPGWAKDDWFYSPALAGGGAMLDMGIHAIDQCIWHLGPVKSVQAMARTLRKRIKVDDNAVILLEFEKTKALGYIEIGWTSPAGFNGVEIMGDNGCIVQDYASGGCTKVTVGKVTPDMSSAAKLKTRIVDKEPGHGGWATEIRECVKAFKRGCNLGIGIDAGGNALAVALAAFQSSKTGKAVKVRSLR